METKITMEDNQGCQNKGGNNERDLSMWVF